jgi:hypothetical protein
MIYKCIYNGWSQLQWRKWLLGMTPIYTTPRRALPMAMPGWWLLSYTGHRPSWARAWARQAAAAWRPHVWHRQLLECLADGAQAQQVRVGCGHFRGITHERSDEEEVCHPWEQWSSAWGCCHTFCRSQPLRKTATSRCSAMSGTAECKWMVKFSPVQFGIGENFTILKGHGEIFTSSVRNWWKFHHFFFTKKSKTQKPKKKKLKLVKNWWKNWWKKIGEKNWWKKLMKKIGEKWFGESEWWKFHQNGETFTMNHGEIFTKLVKISPVISELVKISPIFFISPKSRKTKNTKKKTKSKSLDRQKKKKKKKKKWPGTGPKIFLITKNMNRRAGTGFIFHFSCWYRAAVLSIFLGSGQKFLAQGRYHLANSLFGSVFSAFAPVPDQNFSEMSPKWTLISLD